MIDGSRDIPGLVDEIRIGAARFRVVISGVSADLFPRTPHGQNRSCSRPATLASSTNAAHRMSLNNRLSAPASGERQVIDRPRFDKLPRRSPFSIHKLTARPAKIASAPIVSSRAESIVGSSHCINDRNVSTHRLLRTKAAFVSKHIQLCRRHFSIYPQRY